MALLPEEEKWLEEIWKRKKFERMTFLELKSLYEWFKNRCKELGLDPKNFDFEMILDSTLDYYENKTKLEELLIGYAIPSKEIEELEFYKRLAEKYEKELNELKKKKYHPKIDEILNQIKKLKEEIRKMRDVYITKRELIDVLKVFAKAIKDELDRIHKESFEIAAYGELFAEPRKLEIEISLKKPVKDLFLIQSVENHIKIAEEIIGTIREQSPELGNIFGEFLNRYKILFEQLKDLGYSLEEQRTRLKIRDAILKNKEFLDRFYKEKLPSYKEYEEKKLTFESLQRVFNTIYGSLFYL